MPTPDLTTLTDAQRSGLTDAQRAAMLRAPASRVGWFDLLGMGRKFGVLPLDPADVGDQDVFPRPAAAASSHPRPTGSEVGFVYPRRDEDDTSYRRL